MYLNFGSKFQLSKTRFENGSNGHMNIKKFQRASKINVCQKDGGDSDVGDIVMLVT